MVRASPSASLNTPARDASCVPLSLVIVASAMAAETVDASLGGATGEGDQLNTWLILLNYASRPAALLQTIR